MNPNDLYYSDEYAYTNKNHNLFSLFRTKISNSSQFHKNIIDEELIINHNII